MVGPPELPEHIKDLGPEQVRLMMQTGRLATAFFPSAEQWLAQKTHEDRERNDASQVSQIRIALSARLAAWIAAIAAIIAAIAAIVTVIVEIVKK
jgi:hypothetical protein